MLQELSQRQIEDRPRLLLLLVGRIGSAEDVIGTWLIFMLDGKQVSIEGMLGKVSNRDRKVVC